jgi:hypothetical protein
MNLRRGWCLPALAALAGLLSGPADAYRLTKAQREAQLSPAFLEARSKEMRGKRNELYSAYYDRLIALHGEPQDDLGLSPNLFLRAQRGIVNRAAVDAVTGPFLPSKAAGDLPVGMFQTFHDEIERTFVRRLGLVAPVASGLAARLEAEAVRLAGVDYDAYKAAVGQRPSATDRRLAVLTAMDALYASSRIDVGFEVPFVAGYDRDDGSYVMIDCSVPLAPVLGGQAFPVAKLLNLHERIEKGLLDEYGLRYQSAHQIALRTEKYASDTMHLRWKSYDDMITTVAERIYARVPRLVSDRLDLQPYYSFTDAASQRLAGRITRALVDTPRFARLIDKAEVGRIPTPAGADGCAPRVSAR